MQLRSYPILPNYMDYWNKSILSSPYQISVYVARALRGNYIAGDATCNAGGGFFYNWDIEVINQLGQSLVKFSTVACVDKPVDTLPTTIMLNNYGNINLYKADNIGFFGLFWDGLTGWFNSYPFKIVLAVALSDPAFIKGVKGTLGDLRDWGEKIIYKYSPEWLDNFFSGVETFMTIMFQEYGKFYTQIHDLEISILQDIYPAVQYLQKTVAAWEDTIKTVQADLETVRSTIENPVIKLQSEVFGPLKIEKAKIDSALAIVGDFLGNLHINFVKDWAKWLDTEYTRTVGRLDYSLSAELKKLDLKISSVDDFINLIYKPVQKKLDETRKYLDAAIEFMEKDNLASARLSRTPLQNTLGSYPATLSGAVGASVSSHRIEKVEWPEKKENVLPEVAWWENELAVSDGRLYTDSAGELTEIEPYEAVLIDALPGRAPWERVSVPNAIQHPDINHIFDIQAMLRLYDKGVDQGEVPDAVLSPEEVAEIKWTIAESVGLLLIPFSWLAFMEYEYSLAAIQTVIEGPDMTYEIEDAEEKAMSEFWDDLLWWSKYLPYQYPPYIGP